MTCGEWGCDRPAIAIVRTDRADDLRPRCVRCLRDDLDRDQLQLLDELDLDLVDDDRDDRAEFFEGDGPAGVGAE